MIKNPVANFRAGLPGGKWWDYGGETANAVTEGSHPGSRYVSQSKGQKRNIFLFFIFIGLISEK